MSVSVFLNIYLYRYGYKLVIFSEVYRRDLSDDKAVTEQGYTMFLGGARKETLGAEVREGLTVSAFLRGAGVTICGSLVEYQLSEIEDLKIISLILQPSNERRYVCQCMTEKDKLPMHIFAGNTSMALTRLSHICQCNLNFIHYFKK